MRRLIMTMVLLVGSACGEHPDAGTEGNPCRSPIAETRCDDGLVCIQDDCDEDFCQVEPEDSVLDLPPDIRPGR